MRRAQLRKGWQESGLLAGLLVEAMNARHWCQGGATSLNADMLRNQNFISVSSSSECKAQYDHDSSGTSSRCSRSMDNGVRLNGSGETKANKRGEQDFRKLREKG